MREGIDQGASQRVYISGPMTGLPEHNFPAFHNAAKRLRALGVEVVNPAEINPEPGMPWAWYMRRDIKALMDCDAVATLPGWENSKGATLEVQIATALGMPVHPVIYVAAMAGLSTLSRAFGELTSTAKGISP